MNSQHILPIALLILIFFCSSLKGQTTITINDNYAKFKGGDTALFKYLKDSVVSQINTFNLADTLLTRVIAKFIITSSGKTMNANIVKGSSSKNVDKLLIRAILNMPNWIPAIVNGKNVDQEFILPLIVEQN